MRITNTQGGNEDCRSITLIAMPVLSGWQLTIKEQRRQLLRLLKDNPSLHARLDEFIADTYLDAILLAAKESGLDEAAFPAQCPYTQDELLNAEVI